MAGMYPSALLHLSQAAHLGLKGLLQEGGQKPPSHHCLPADIREGAGHFVPLPSLPYFAMARRGRGRDSSYEEMELGRLFGTFPPS